MKIASAKVLSSEGSTNTKGEGEITILFFFVVGGFTDTRTFPVCVPFVRSDRS
jgi:hypothetical protein